MFSLIFISNLLTSACSEYETIGLEKTQILNVASYDPIFVCYDGSPIQKLTPWGTLQFKVVSNCLHKLQESSKSEKPDSALERILTWIKSKKAYKNETILEFSPFNDPPCFSLEAIEIPCLFSTIVSYKPLNWKLIAFLISGTVLFFTAETLSKSTLFFYLIGSTLFTIFATFILSVFLYRMFRIKGIFGVGYLSIMGSLSVFGTGFIYRNLNFLILQYPHLLLSYVVITYFITFSILYFYNSQSNPRIHNLIQWALQCCAVGLFYLSSQNNTAFFITLLIVTFSWIVHQRKKFVSKIITNMKNPHLFTMDTLFSLFHRLPTTKTKHIPSLIAPIEQLIQRQKTTNVSIEELRNCLKMDTKKTAELICRARDPERIKSFLAGGDHISVDDRLIVNAEISKSFMIDQEEFEKDLIDLEHSFLSR